MSDEREFYRSSNGDAWYLGREASDGRAFVIHRPNVSSGGRTSDIELAEFLKRGNGPEQQELLRLIGESVVAAPSNPTSAE